MASVTAATLALGIAETITNTKQPPAGMVQPDSMVPAAQVVAVWIQGTPENVDFIDMPSWDSTTTPGNQTDVVDANAVGCSLAYMSACRAAGVSMATIQAAVQANPKLALSSIPGAPEWFSFMQMMSAAGWKQNDDPCNGFGMTPPITMSIPQMIVAIVAADLGVVATAAQNAKAVADVTSALAPAPEPSN